MSFVDSFLGEAASAASSIFALRRAGQRLLIAMGISCGPDGADGDFGPGTENAVKKFRQRSGLPGGGTVDAGVWEKLLRG